MERAHSRGLLSSKPACSHGAVRNKKYHAVSMFKYTSGIIALVSKSIIGYFKSATADTPSPTEFALDDDGGHGIVQVLCFSAMAVRVSF
jgi:hypothetical protein